ncbi:PKD domain-containing protein [bacterium SCSIO 12741]|nr:PKD domain-containing protein [bacterium SCSIO 12741]
MRLLTLGILLLLVASSCEKKEFPDNSYDEPDFFLSGKVDDQAYNQTAGDNNYYMNTQASQDANGVWEYYGKLEPAGCQSGCTRTVALRFRESQPGRVPIEVLKKGSIDFKQKDTRPTYTIEFDASETYTSNANGVTYSWNFGDGGSAEGVKTTHTFNLDQSYYDVCLTVNTSKGRESELCTRVYPGNDCKAGFELEYGGNVLLFRAQNTGGVAKKYLWEFSNGITATTPTLEMVHDQFQSTEQVCLTITDHLGCISQSCQNVIVNEETTFTAANFETEVSENIVQNGELQLNTVVVEYEDEYGVFYSTEINPQDPSHEFEILTIEEYSLTNDNRTPVKRMQVLFSCEVFSATGESKKLTDMTGWIGVAYPI